MDFQVKKVWVMMLTTLMVSSTMMAGNVKKSTTLPIEGEIVKASHPMIQYVGRVSFAKNPDVASFNYPGTTIEASFQGSSLKMLCRPKSGSTPYRSHPDNIQTNDYGHYYN